MKRTAFTLPMALTALVLTASAGSLMAQLSSPVASTPAEISGASQTMPPPQSPRMEMGPLDGVAFGAGFSPLGVNIMAATNLNRFMNLRATGDVLILTENGIKTNGFIVNANLNLASARVAVDLFPSHRSGFFVSPGVMLYNRNGANAVFRVDPSTSFELNHSTYYSSKTNPVTGNGSIGLHNKNPAWTMAVGWGNAVPRDGRHWSFPVEIGVAFIGAPSLNVALTGGQVCNSSGLDCVNVATDAQVQSNLKSQVAIYKNNINQLKTYPIVSFGLVYSFRVRPY